MFSNDSKVFLAGFLGKHAFIILLCIGLETINTCIASIWSLFVLEYNFSLLFLWALRTTFVLNICWVADHNLPWTLSFSFPTLLDCYSSVSWWASVTSLLSPVHSAPQSIDSSRKTWLSSWCSSLHSSACSPGSFVFWCNILLWIILYYSRAWASCSSHVALLGS